MSKDRIKKLEAYLASIKQRLEEAEVPEKHKVSPKTYRDFLQNEAALTQARINNLKLTV